jgi:hypothetical protein
MMARKIANPNEKAISLVKPDLCSAKPPLRPKAINKYSDRKREICGGTSRLDLTDPAKTPKIKNRIAGSRKLVIYLFHQALRKHAYPQVFKFNQCGTA